MKRRSAVGLSSLAWRCRLCLVLSVGLFGGAFLSAAEGPASQDLSSDVDAAKELFVGKVVLLPKALERRGVRVYDEMKGQVVLETADGELIPLVSDWRGRAFFQDERLRDRKVELVGTRPAGTPYLQVLMVFTFDEQGERQYTDYWCDICAIPMYEIKPCDCCQGETRLRFQPQDLPEYITAPRGTGRDD